MKKNFASSTPQSKKKQLFYLQLDQILKQTQISQFNSTEDQSQSDWLKNDESLISNDLSSAYSAFQLNQDNQDNRENQMEFINNDDDLKMNADLIYLIQSTTDKINQINLQNDNNHITENSENEQSDFPNQNQEYHENLYYETSHQLNLIENQNQDQIPHIQKEKFSFGNKKSLFIEINNEEVKGNTQYIEQQQNQQVFEKENNNAIFSLHQNLQKTSPVIQDIENGLINNFKYSQNSQEDDFYKFDNMQSQLIEEYRQDLEVNQYKQMNENNELSNNEEEVNKNKNQSILDQKSQKGSMQNDQSEDELKSSAIIIDEDYINIVKQTQNNLQQLEQQQQQADAQILENYEFTNQDNFENQNLFEFEKNNNLDQNAESGNQEITINYTEDIPMNQQNQNNIDIMESQTPNCIQLQIQQSKDQPQSSQNDQELQVILDQKEESLQYIEELISNSDKQFEQNINRLQNQNENQIFEEQNDMKSQFIESDSLQEKELDYQERINSQNYEVNRQDQSKQNIDQGSFCDQQLKITSIDEDQTKQSQLNLDLNIDQIEEEQVVEYRQKQQKKNQEFDELDQLQQNKENELLDQVKQIIYERKGKKDQLQIISEKSLDQELQVDDINYEINQEAEQKSQQSSFNLQQSFNTSKDRQNNFCKELEQIIIQDSGFEKSSEIDSNNYDIQQQVNLEKIEIQIQYFNQEGEQLVLQELKPQSLDNEVEHQVQTAITEEYGYCNKEIIVQQNSQNFDQNALLSNLSCIEQEMEQIQQQAKNVFQPQINNFSQQNQKMNQDIESSEDHQTDSNFLLNDKGTLSKNQQDQELTISINNNLSESSQKKQSILLIDNSEHQDYQEEQNQFKLEQNEEKIELERQNITFCSEQKKSQQSEQYFLSQTKIKNQEDFQNQNQSCNSQQQIQKEYSSSKSNDIHNNIELGHSEQNRDNIDDQQRQREQKIRELEQQIEQAQREINEKDEEIKLNQDMITTFENFIIQDYNLEDFEKSIYDESNFETDNHLINHLIKKLRQFLQDFQKSIIDLINRFDGKTEFDKEEDGEKDRDFKTHDKQLNVITKEFKKFTQKQQKKDIVDYNSQITIQDSINKELIITNNDLDQLISDIISQTKLLRDILQKSCCLIIKFNCEVYNGLQGMSKNRSQLEQIRSLTNSVKQKTYYFQTIINEQVDLQQVSATYDHILLLDLLKQLIFKQEEAQKFQQFFTNYLFDRIDLVHQSEENLREDMARMLQTFN